MQLAVAEGPNHWPGCFPQVSAPCWTNRWMENGALGSSANSDTTLLSSANRSQRRQSSLTVSNEVIKSKRRLTAA